MEKVPFTTAGVNLKQTELFSLSQTDLDNESTFLSNDYRTWITDNFELTSQQQDYLNSADDAFIRLLSSVVFVSVRNRIPLNFTISTVVTSVKRFETQAKFDFNYNWGGALEQNTELNLDIVYI